MDLFSLIGLTSALAAFAAFALLIRILRRARSERSAMDRAYFGIESLTAASDEVRRRSRALLFPRTPSRRLRAVAD